MMMKIMNFRKNFFKKLIQIIISKIGIIVVILLFLISGLYTSYKDYSNYLFDRQQQQQIINKVINNLIMQKQCFGLTPEDKGFLICVVHLQLIAKQLDNIYDFSYKINNDNVINKKYLEDMYHIADTYLRLKTLDKSKKNYKENLKYLAKIALKNEEIKLNYDIESGGVNPILLEVDLENGLKENYESKIELLEPQRVF